MRVSALINDINAAVVAICFHHNFAQGSSCVVMKCVWWISRTCHLTVNVFLCLEYVATVLFLLLLLLLLKSGHTHTNANGTHFASEQENSWRMELEICERASGIENRHNECGIWMGGFSKIIHNRMKQLVRIAFVHTKHKHRLRLFYSLVAAALEIQWKTSIRFANTEQHNGAWMNAHTFHSQNVFEWMKQNITLKTALNFEIAGQQQQAKELVSVGAYLIACNA